MLQNLHACEATAMLWGTHRPCRSLDLSSRALTVNRVNKIQPAHPFLQLAPIAASYHPCLLDSRTASSDQDPDSTEGSSLEHHV